MFNRQLTLILPRLAPLLAQAVNAALLPDKLAKFRQRAKQTELTQSLSAYLLSQFNQADDSSHDLPMARVRRPYSDALCADPCYLHPDRDQLRLFAEGIDLEPAEAAALIATIQPLLDDFGGRLIADTPSSWTLELQQLPTLQLTAISEVEGQTVTAHLPTGQDKQDWLRLLNEIQMVLFEHPINQQRQDAGKLPINSIWLWGSGKFVADAGHWQQLVGKAELLQQLSDIAQVPHLSLCEDFSTWLDALPAGKSLYLYPDFDEQGDWPTQLTVMENTLFVPLWRQLQSARLREVELVIPHHAVYRMTPFRSWLPL